MEMTKNTIIIRVIGVLIYKYYKVLNWGFIYKYCGFWGCNFDNSLFLSISTTKMMADGHFPTKNALQTTPTGTSPGLSASLLLKLR